MSILPMEIVDDIMHYAAHILQPHPIGTSSIALLSHRYRSIAHRQTFSSVTFLQITTRRKKGDVYRIHGLAKLIAESGRFPTLPGVHTYITSLSINLSVYQGDHRCTIVSKSLAKIFDNLFRDQAILDTPVRSLILTSSIWSRGIAPEGSLRSLITTSYINSLHLTDAFDLPLGIILGSNIIHLTLNRFIISYRNEPMMACNSVPLKSLSIKEAHPNEITFGDITMVVCGLDSPAPEMFSHLTTLCISVSSATLASSLVNSTTVLESLTLHNADRLFPTSKTDEKPAIQFKLLKLLKELDIRYWRTIDNKKPKMSPVTFLGDEAPPLLETITLKIFIHSNLCAPFPPPADDLKAAVEERREMSEWDRHLFSWSVFGDLKRIKVEFFVLRHVFFGGQSQIVPNWDEAWCSYFMGAFPMCKEAYGDVVVRYSSSWSILE